MNIPHAFNPLGNMTDAGMPYIQPYMTGAKTWSNSPSFGCVIEATNAIFGPAYAMFRDENGSGDYYWGSKQNGAENVVTFEKPLKIKSVNWQWILATWQPYTLEFYTSTDGKIWTLQASEYTNTNNYIGLYRTTSNKVYAMSATFSRPQFAKYLKLKIVNNDTYAAVAKLQLNAVFLP